MYLLKRLKASLNYSSESSVRSLHAIIANMLEFFIGNSILENLLKDSIVVILENS